jgi:hypothetical protein
MIERRELRAVLAAAILSGLPSTVHALGTGTDPLLATRAAGTLLPGRRSRPGVVAGAFAHVLISSGWSAVLIAVDRRHPLGARGGAVAGLAIAAADLELFGRGYPEIRKLPRLPQWLDHLAFGTILGACLRHAPEPAAVLPPQRDRLSR